MKDKIKSQAENNLIYRPFLNARKILTLLPTLIDTVALEK